MFPAPIPNVEHSIYIIDPKLLIPAIIDEHNNPELIHLLSACGRLKSKNFANFHITEQSINYLLSTYGNKDGKINVIKGILLQAPIDSEASYIDSLFVYASLLKPTGIDIVIITDNKEIQERAKAEEVKIDDLSNLKEKVKEMLKCCGATNDPFLIQ